METENEYLDLPDDPEEAFATLQARKYKGLEEAWENGWGGRHCERQYVDHLIAFDEVHDLGILTAFRTPPTGDQEFSDYFQDFRRHAEIASQKILMGGAATEDGRPTNCRTRFLGTAGNPRVDRENPGEAKRAVVVRVKARVAVQQVERLRS